MNFQSVNLIILSDTEKGIGKV